MNVIVVGCGRVGSALALNLSEAGHEVTVVDRRADSFARLGTEFKGRTLVGIGFDRDRLIEAGIEQAGALAAVTSGDNSNVLIARVARETFGIERVVARIYDPRRASIYQRLGIATVATVAWTTERVLRRLLPDEPSIDWVDPSAKVMLVERQVPAAWAGRNLSDLELAGVAKVAAYTRLGSAQIPAHDVVLQDGDLLHVTVLGDALDLFDKHLAAPVKHGGH